MHVVFFAYGIKDKVDLFLRDLQCQKFKLPFKKKNGKEAFVWVQGSLRQLPLGMYDYVFPKESLDAVLNTLKFDSPSYYPKHKFGKYLVILRKIFKLKKHPKYSKKNNYVWFMNDVALIPVGIREDEERWFSETNLFHEAL